jgi:hypothetical protein
MEPTTDINAWRILNQQIEGAKYEKTCLSIDTCAHAKFFLYGRLHGRFDLVRLLHDLAMFAIRQVGVVDVGVIGRPPCDIVRCLAMDSCSYHLTTATRKQGVGPPEVHNLDPAISHMWRKKWGDPFAHLRFSRHVTRHSEQVGSQPKSIQRLVLAELYPTLSSHSLNGELAKVIDQRFQEGIDIELSIYIPIPVPYSRKKVNKKPAETSEHLCIHLV